MFLFSKTVVVFFFPSGILTFPMSSSISFIRVVIQSPSHFLKHKHLVVYVPACGCWITTSIQTFIDIHNFMNCKTKEDFSSYFYIYFNHISVLEKSYNCLNLKWFLLSKISPRGNISQHLFTFPILSDKPGSDPTQVHSGEPVNVLSFLTEPRWGISCKSVETFASTICTWIYSTRMGAFNLVLSGLCTLYVFPQAMHSVTRYGAATYSAKNIMHYSTSLFWAINHQPAPLNVALQGGHHWTLPRQ